MKRTSYVLYVSIAGIQPGKISYKFPYSIPGSQRVQHYKCGYPEQNFDRLRDLLDVGKTYRVVSNHRPEITGRSVWVWDEVVEVDAGAVDYEADAVFTAQKLREYELKKWYDTRPEGYERKVASPIVYRDPSTLKILDLFDVDE